MNADPIRPAPVILSPPPADEESVSPPAPPEPADGRRRGGQPANQNARKHGFYSRYLSPDEQLNIQEAEQLTDLLPELALMRVKLLHLAVDPTCRPEVLIQAVRTVTRLLDVHHRLTRFRR